MAGPSAGRACRPPRRVIPVTPRHATGQVFTRCPARAGGARRYGFKRADTGFLPTHEGTEGPWGAPGRQVDRPAATNIRFPTRRYGRRLDRTPKDSQIIQAGPATPVGKTTPPPASGPRPRVRPRGTANRSSFPARGAWQTAASAISSSKNARAGRAFGSSPLEGHPPSSRAAGSKGKRLWRRSHSSRNCPGPARVLARSLSRCWCGDLRGDSGFFFFFKTRGLT